MKVLTVDDSRTVRFLIKKILKGMYGEELVFHEAADGLEGLKATEQHQFDYVFLDVNMPHMNGLELLEKLNAAGYPATIGFVSSLGVAQNLEQAKALGAKFFIDKPLTEAKLKQVMGAGGSKPQTSATKSPASGHSLQQVLDSLVADLSEAIQSSLAGTGIEKTGTVQEIESPLYGAKIDLVTSAGEFTVFLSLSARHCQELTDQILDNVTSPDDFLPDIDAGDALGEVMNTIAGMTLKKLYSHDGAVRLGLPQYLDGAIFVGDYGDKVGYEINIGQVPATLVLASSMRKAA